MGNCCERCLGRLDKRRYLRTRYNVERDISIEFENLMDEDPQEHELPQGQLELSRPFTVSSYMRWLVHQEEELRREEEAYYEAKREAARAAKAARHKEAHGAAGGPSSSDKLMSSKALTTTGAGSGKDPNTWLGDDDSDWEMAGGEEDFDMFLECVRARSLAAKTQAAATGGQQDGASESSSKDDRSKTEASSIDLEWEHEAGMQPPPKVKQRRHHGTPKSSPRIAELVVKPGYLQLLDEPGGGEGQGRINEGGGSSYAVVGRGSRTVGDGANNVLSADDFEWDNDYVTSPNEAECRTLLTRYPNSSSDR